MKPNKSLPIAYLLWLFTGVFGGHRWYLGKRWSALAMSIAGVYLVSSAVLLGYAGLPLYSIYNDLPFKLLDQPQIELAGIFNGGWFLGIAMCIYILLAWLVPLRLLFDLFWVYAKLKKQSKGLIQQQVEAFD